MEGGVKDHVGECAPYRSRRDEGLLMKTGKKGAE